MTAIYFAIRHDEAPDGLIRQEGGNLEILHMEGDWRTHSSLLDKLQDPFVEPVSADEAAVIAMRRGAWLKGDDDR